MRFPVARAAAVVTLLLTAFPAFAQQTAAPKPAFAIVDGDRVLFFGDSITEQRLYTTDIEEFLLTRFPDRHVEIFQSGVGGDKVSGGKFGPIDLRLHRDVYDHNPTVITSMLGMNDGFYRAYDPDIFSAYANGYRYIVDELQKKFPAARITLIKPSAYDDVTRAEMMKGGYNGVLIRFSDFLGDLANEKKTGIADLNTPVVDALKKAKVYGPGLATTLIPDRVHPGPAIHWVMAEAVLKSWNAPSEVTTVRLNAAKLTTEASSNADVSRLVKSPNGISWTEQDRALPLPFGPMVADPAMELIFRSSDLISALDQESLVVTGLPPGTYQLKIDDRAIATFSADQLAKGVNLALLESPMLEQSRRVAHDTDIKNGSDRAWFEMNAKSPDDIVAETLKALANASDAADTQARKDAIPVPHNFELSALGQTISPAPSKKKK